jgi:4-amino-4-deoxy-L-arabinose transferase-like glycosyltransferase
MKTKPHLFRKPDSLRNLHLVIAHPFHRFRISGIILLFLVFALIATTYLYHFSNIPFFRMDEGWDMQAPLEFLQHGQLGSPMLENGGDQTHYFHVHPPLFYLAVAGFYRIFGFGISPARLSSFLFGSLTLIVLCQILKRQSPQQHLPLFFVFIGVASVPLFFVVSKTVRPDIMLAFFFWSAYYCLVQWRTKQSLVWLAFGALSSGLMVLTHYFGLPVILLWGYQLLRKKAWKHLVLFLFILGLTLFPYALWVFDGWAAFKAQVLVFRGFGEFKPFSRLAWTLWVMSSTIKTGLIVVMLFLGVVLSLARYPSTRGVVFSDVIWLGGGFILQFAILPRYNVLYGVLMVPLIPIVYQNLTQAYSRRLIYGVLAAFIVINSLGLGLYIWKYKDFSYDRYHRQLRSAVMAHYHPGNSILGSTSMYPIFYDLPYQAFESLYAKNLTAAQVIQIIDKQQLIVVDEYIPSRLNPEVLDHITKKRECVEEILSSDYGSEGNHPNNVIRVYQ